MGFQQQCDLNAQVPHHSSLSLQSWGAVSTLSDLYTSPLASHYLPQNSHLKILLDRTAISFMSQKGIYKLNIHF